MLVLSMLKKHSIPLTVTVFGIIIIIIIIMTLFKEEAQLDKSNLP